MLFPSIKYSPFKQKIPISLRAASAGSDPVRGSGTSAVESTGVVRDHRNGQRAFLTLDGGIDTFAKHWSMRIQLRLRSERCEPAQCEGRKGAMVCLRQKRRGLLHLLSVRGAHVHGRPHSRIVSSGLRDSTTLSAVFGNIFSW